VGRLQFCEYWFLVVAFVSMNPIVLFSSPKDLGKFV